MEEATATGLLRWNRNIQAYNRTGDFAAISHWSLGDMRKVLMKTLITGVCVLHLGPFGCHEAYSSCEHSHNLPCPSLSQRLNVFESISFSALKTITLEKPSVGALLGQILTDTRISSSYNPA